MEELLQRVFNSEELESVYGDDSYFRQNQNELETLA
jgi:hypothetical protein